MKNFLLKTCLTLLCMIMGVGSAWATDELYYTLSAVKSTGNTAYASNYDVTINGIKWSTPGNQNFDGYWRIGGKSIAAASRTIQGKESISSTISKIIIYHNGVSNEYLKLNSVKLTVSSNPDFTDERNLIDNVELTPTVAVSTKGSFVFTPSQGTQWAANSYYRIEFIVSNSKTSNYGLDFTKAEFFKESTNKAISSISVKTAPTKITYTEGETFDPAGLVITKTFTDSNTEDVEYSSTNASDFSFNPSLTTALATTNTSVTITYGGKSTIQTITVKEIPTHTAHFSINGTINEANDCTVKEGADITFPAAPTDINGKKFRGWTTISDYSNETSAPSDICKSANMGSSDITYYAVYASQTGEGGAGLELLNGTSEFNDGDDIVVVAESGSKYYVMYQETVSTSYVNYKMFDHTPELDDVNNDSKMSWTLTSQDDNTWKLGDATNGYLYNDSNNLTASTANSSAVSITWDSESNKFTIKNGNRWIACRADLTTGGNQYKFRGAGTNNSPTNGSVAYFDIYRISNGVFVYSDFCTIVGDPLTQTTLTWSKESYSATIGADNTYPTLTKSPDDIDGIIYSSSNTNAATIDANTGEITLVNAGTTTITASFAGNATYKASSASYELTVNAAPDTRAEVNITSFTTVGGVKSIVKGNTLATNVSIEPNDCSVSYAYSSNKSSVATVDENGVITAVGNGSARITVSLTVVDTENYKAGTTTSKYVDITVTAASHTATFYVDGREKYTTVVEEGKAIPFPAESPEDINDKQFMGWTANPIPEPVNDEPEYVQSANMGEVDVNFYAVFANLHGEGGTVSSSNLLATTNGEIVLVEGKPIKYNTKDKAYNGNPLRVLDGNILSIYGANITEIVLEGTSSSYPVTRLGLNDDQSGTINTDNGIVTWKGSAKCVEFKASGQARVSTMTVKFGNAYYDGYCTTISDAEYYRINYYVSGQLAKSDEVIKDKVLEFPHVDDISATKVFRGWTANPEIDDDSDILSISGLRASEDVCYYAVFATPTTKSGNKVWSRLAPLSDYDWLKPGNQYLFVYETSDTNGNVFNGLDDNTDNYEGNVVISNGTITESFANQYVYITMKTENTTHLGFTINGGTNDGYRMCSNKSDTGLRILSASDVSDSKILTDKAYLNNDISVNGNDEWRVKCYNYNLRFRNDRFTYFSEETNASNKPIQIYVYESIDYRDFTTNNPSVTISQYNYTTYCSKIDYKMPEDVEGKIITAAESTSTPGAYNLTTSTKYNAGDVVPAGVSLMLYSSKAEEYTIIPSMAEKDAEVITYPDNLLVSEYTVDNGKLLTSYDYVNKDNYYYYKLTTKNKENFGWYYGETDGAPFYMSRADRAYLVIDKTKGNSIKSFVMFDIEKGEEGTLTDIESLEANDNSIAIYNLQGQRINRTDKGVYIVNGRKVIR